MRIQTQINFKFHFWSFTFSNVCHYNSCIVHVMLNHWGFRGHYKLQNDTKFDTIDCWILKIQTHPLCVVLSISLFPRNAQAFCGSQRVNFISNWCVFLLGIFVLVCTDVLIFSKIYSLAQAGSPLWVKYQKYSDAISML